MFSDSTKRKNTRLEASSTATSNVQSGPRPRVNRADCHRIGRGSRWPGDAHDDGDMDARAANPPTNWRPLTSGATSPGRPLTQIIGEHFGKKLRAGIGIALTVKPHGFDFDTHDSMAIRVNDARSQPRRARANGLISDTVGARASEFPINNNLTFLLWYYTPAMYDNAVLTSMLKIIILNARKRAW